MYPEYRANTTLEIVNHVKKGLSFKIEGISGVGKSKYLRYISTSPTLKKDYWDSEKIKFVYLDLNLLYQDTTEQLIETIIDKLELQKNSSEIEKQLPIFAKKYNRICIAFDHSERLVDFEEKTVRYLRALLYNSTNKLCYIFAYEAGRKEDLETIKYLDTISPTKIILGPLSPKDTIKNIDISSKAIGLKLTKPEIEQVAQYTKGYAKKIKYVFNELQAGKTITAIINEDNKSAQSENNSVTSSNKDKDNQESKTSNLDNTLATVIRYSTKKEYVVFKTIYENRGDIVTKNTIAEILSPDSIGDGVSNESIDQIISRLRKSIKKADLHIDIKTKRGFGYYID